MSNGAAQKQGSNWFAWVLGGCGCLIFAGGAIFLGIYFGVMKATAGPEQAIKEFLAAAAAGDVERAHGYFSQPLKEVQSLDALRSEVTNNPELFNVVETSYSSRSIDMTKAELKGTVKLKDGQEKSAEFTLIQENGAWKLLGYHIGQS